MPRKVPISHKVTFVIMVISIALIICAARLENAQGYRNYRNVDAKEETLRFKNIGIGMSEQDVYQLYGPPDRISRKDNNSWTTPVGFYDVYTDCSCAVRLYYSLPTFLSALHLEETKYLVVEVDRNGIVVGRAKLLDSLDG